MVLSLLKMHEWHSDIEPFEPRLIAKDPSQTAWFRIKMTNNAVGRSENTSLLLFLKAPNITLRQIHTKKNKASDFVHAWKYYDKKNQKVKKDQS